uniref:BPTI/Kunitz inhibitor domain-containing protein n=1 Tax=Glossina brevipalpis TaxID=37001 RepID=A0A1A9WWD5_9MUSC
MKLFKVLFVIVAAIISATSVAAFSDDMNSACDLPPAAMVSRRSVGCSSRLPSWTYNAKFNQCTQFEYNGCGGNRNRFYTLYDCERECKKY